MERIAFFDAKPYDRIYFDKLNRDFELVYFESRLRPESVKLAEGCRAVCAFVNDDIGASTVRSLADRKSTRLNSSHTTVSRMPSSA